MNVTEYIYVDERRLDSYLEQVSSRRAYDKVPVWKTAGSLVGPQVEVTQARFPRDLTIHEKVGTLVDRFRSHELIDSNEPTYNPDKVFRLETFQAIRFHIPPSSSRSMEFKGLNLWVSGYPVGPNAEAARPRHVIYLLEDYPNDDGAMWHHTSFSIFAALVRDIQAEFSQTVVGHALHDHDSLPEQWYRQSPTQLLQTLGARMGADRRITSLYRLRATFSDRWSHPWEPGVTYGYPIFIVEAAMTRNVAAPNTAAGADG